MTTQIAAPSLKPTVAPSLKPTTAYDKALSSLQRPGPSQPQAAGAADDPARVRAAARDFEAMFLGEMFNHMFEGLDVDPMFGGGQGEEMFRSMLTQEYGKIMAKSHNGIGLADQVQKAMIAMQQNHNQGG